MKKYVLPKIKKVELEPRQAVLSVCNIGYGKYFLMGNHCMIADISTTDPNYCVQSVKGVKDSLAFCN